MDHFKQDAADFLRGELEAFSATGLVDARRFIDEQVDKVLAKPIPAYLPASVVASWRAEQEAVRAQAHKQLDALAAKIEEGQRLQIERVEHAAAGGQVQ